MTTHLRRLADYVAEFVAAQGVGCVFLVPGGGAMYLVDAVGACPALTYVPNHHEQASAIAAEAYARVNGRLGCALVTTGPGATNAITGCAGAWIESVPLLIISGQVKRDDLIGASGVRQMGPQEVDIVSIVRPITKYAATVMEPAAIRRHLEEAVHRATTGRRGPVWLDIPLDVQNATIDVAALAGFAPPSPDASTGPTEAQLDAVMGMVARAERPIILAGHGIRLAEAAGAFRELYETLQIPVVTTWNAADLIPAAHPLSVGKPGTVALRAPNFAVQNADLVIAIGARLDNVVTAHNPAKFGRHAQKVVVDVDAAELAKFSENAGFSLRIEADARDFIGRLLPRAREAAPVDRSGWLARCADWKRRYPINDGAPFPTEGPIGHFHLTQMLSEELPEDGLIVTGSSGLAVEFFHTGFQNKPGQRVFLTSGLGAMGYGLPAMIGAYMASDRRPFVGIESDGSLMMNVQELQTIASLGMPVRMFVFNNNGYASIRTTQRNYFEGRYVGSGPQAKLDIPDLVALAKTFGWDAFAISDVADLRDGIRRALDHPGPLLVDVRVIETEALFPKSAALPQADGSMRSMPLEDMSPLLPRDEFRANMIVPLDPASETVPEYLIVRHRSTDRTD
ncbi:thiamine pyrophosphate-binding protein [Methylobacterium sp. WL30]|uniref:thiamine pyrophosphate-binding protein n=1 Tax=unclassified Methylobacterium TaxID=2615210 RepID=UPI0011CB9FC7|nr:MULTISPECIES: thiamine pyrophosphate-binding protein [unclassified Methylobacterium]TXN39013.1 thiamine pyrophosphate-binding protein [Methylobacterium sp. WL93]TXN50198.1 thiamine pyrophosphate-binding protein [Methylobacterium sp. WL119]TXN67384.1 thiamine pyrophosphate-binding protein [Methylobacterium sp. WL30]